MNVLISGGSGLVGTILVSRLRSKGYQPGILTRSVKGLNGVKEFTWNIEENRIDPAALEWADHIIHLAGENVGQRWTKAVKQKILISRVNSTKIFADALLSGDFRIKSFVSASGVGIYGDTGETEVNESSPPGSGFLADVVQNWENAVNQLKPNVEHLVKLRIGVVLSADGGALEKMILPIKLGVGSPLGSGNQWMSWIDINDLCNMFVFAIENGLNGVYNAVSPNPVTNAQMTRDLAQKFRRPLFMPNVPAFVLRMVLGEMSAMVLEGNKVSSMAIQQEGFTFEFETLKKSLGHLF